MEDFDPKYDNMEPIREEPIRYRVPDRAPDETMYDPKNQIKIWFEENHCIVFAWGTHLYLLGVDGNDILFSTIDKNGITVNPNRIDIRTVNGALKRVVDLYLNHLMLR